MFFSSGKFMTLKNLECTNSMYIMRCNGGFEGNSLRNRYHFNEANYLDSLQRRGLVFYNMPSFAKLCVHSAPSCGKLFKPQSAQRLRRVSQEKHCNPTISSCCTELIRGSSCQGLTIRSASSSFNFFTSANTICAIFRAPSSLKCVLSSFPAG